MENILKQAAKYGSNNTASYGIVNAVEVSGFKQVTAVADLYNIADCILQKDKTGDGSDAVGQKWYVQKESCEYQLTSWAGRKSAAGWTKVALADSATVTALSNKLTTVEGTANTAKSATETNATAITTINKTLASGVVSNVARKVDNVITVTKGGNSTDITINNVAHATTADNATKVNNHTVNEDIPAGAVFTDTITNVAKADKTDAALTISSTSTENVINTTIKVNDFTCTTSGSTHGLVPAVDWASYGPAVASGTSLLLFSDGWGVPSVDTLGISSVINSLEEDISKKVSVDGKLTPYIKSVAKSGNTLTFTTGDDSTTTFTASVYTLPQATDTALGGVKIGYQSVNKNYGIQLDASGRMFVNVPWTDTTYTLPIAGNSALGGIKTGFATTDNIYQHAVKVDASGNAYVESGAPVVVITLASTTSGSFTGTDFAQINACYETGAPLSIKFTDDADGVVMPASLYMDEEGFIRATGIVNVGVADLKARNVSFNMSDKTYAVEDTDLLDEAISETDINNICKIG